MLMVIRVRKEHYLTSMFFTIRCAFSFLGSIKWRMPSLYAALILFTSTVSSSVKLRVKDFWLYSFLTHPIFSFCSFRSSLWLNEIVRILLSTLIEKSSFRQPIVEIQTYWAVLSTPHVPPIYNPFPKRYISCPGSRSENSKGISWHIFAAPSQYRFLS